MAPLKPLNKNVQIAPSLTNYPIKTRSQISGNSKKELFPKRKADGSPLKRLTVKRSAFCDLTNYFQENSKENNCENKGKNILKKSVLGVLTKPPSAQNAKKLSTTTATAKVRELPKTQLVIIPQVKKRPPLNTAAGSKASSAIPKIKPLENKSNEQDKIVSRPVTRGSLTRKSIDSDKVEDGSLYVSALEALDRLCSLDDSQKKPKSGRKLPPNVDDFDQEQTEDLSSVSEYANDIFEYLKSREKNFRICDYMEKQSGINKLMRALLVDWMVEVQENFELNHETLYLSVKIVDLYLSKVIISKDKLQLVGCASLFIACKYDERLPPMIEDFLYVCDDLYSASELTGMEVKILKALDFNLGVPLSYRFLRRYARCSKIQMPLLTLARYILEYSLMDYSMIHYSDSKIAAASLLLAITMKGKGKWTPTLEYYSGFKVADFKDIVIALNEMLHKKPKENMKTIRMKYSHK
ncbi:hypothetical protein AAG570_001402 [Ranatra chinensis]|uniref:G2/mitotic-specific cyclin-B3 n=1 Tax=Ranatra chinensis TaxID=642074 RepID=A0ABD0YBU2_9HEMI